LKLLQRLKSIGPATLITAAFIGPGTVTVCSLAGYRFGYSLLWALLFSVLATIILQEMSARLGLISKGGLGQAIRNQFSSPFGRSLSIILVLSAILIGNGAYEAGNISGAVLGLDTAIAPLEIVVGDKSLNLWGLVIGFIAFLLLYSGSYKVIEKSLIFLVLVMSIVFIITAIVSGPNLKALLKGLLVPSFPDQSWLFIIGLIGTTVVPYNLFLHASSVAKRWKKPENLSAVRFDTFISITLGGIISMAIVVASAASSVNLGGAAISNAADLALQLEPLLGKWAKYFMAAGLFAAGISSSITAPLAAAFATSGILGFGNDLKDPKFRLIGTVILLVGILFSVLGFKPIHVIQFAQAANGILLPLVALFLLWVMNNTGLLGKYRNTWLQNLLGFLVVALAFALGLKSMLSVIGLL